MNAQLLAALGEQVQKAISAAVDPLLARIKELEGRPGYDDSALKSAFSEQGKRVALVVDGVQAIKDRIDEVAKSVPTAYDDTNIRKDLASVIRVLDVANDRLKSIEAAPSSTQRDGIDGRDALQLEILPAIDESKSYIRGTYAKHAGGLWRAYEQTHAMRGWECIVDGVAAVYPSIEGKSFKMTVRSSSGCERYAEAMIPVQVYKGVWSEGDYLSGDTATWAGSLWHCNKDGTTAKPGDGSGDWTLAVKKGRDANQTVSIK